MFDPVALTSHLVAFDSVSSRSNLAITDDVQGLLRSSGFSTERLEFDDPNGVRKGCVIGKIGEGTGGLAYFCHTDVVPADTWSRKPGAFEPVVSEGRLYGRGSCDMKGSLACMLSAASKYEASQFQRPLYIICTADEEVGYRGALQVVKRSKYYRELVQDQVRGIIGEPTSLEVVHAHKGVAGFRATSHGRAAHSSTSKGLNANLAMIPFLVEMKEIHDELVREPRWQHPEFDPPGMCWNIGINDFTTATNITPPRSVCTIGFRPVPGADVDLLADRVAAAAHRHGIELQTTVRFPPLYVPKDHPFVKEMLEIAGQQIPKTVGYGTDGATFTELSRLVVFGPGDIAQAHTDDEWISLDQLNRGVELYARCLEQFCLERA